MILKKHTSRTLLGCLFTTFVSSALPLLKEHIYPSYAFYLEKAGLESINDISYVLTASRNESYVKFLSPQTASLMFLPNTARVDFNYFAKAFADPKAYVAVAKTWYNSTVGFILTRQLSDTIVFIDLFFILPEFQNKKIGRNLISHIFFQAKKNYPHTSYLEVEAYKGGIETLNFYVKQGFKVIKEYSERDYIVCVLLKTV